MSDRYMDWFHGDEEEWHELYEHILWKEDIKEELKRIESQALHERSIRQAYEERHLRWKTLAGKRIFIQDMNTNHIYNCIAHLARRGKGDSIMVRIFKTELDKRLKDGTPNHQDDYDQHEDN